MEQSVNTDVLLNVVDLKKHFDVKDGMFSRSKNQKIKAVNGISFDVKKGETFSVVGESGCGKSTTGMCLLRLTEPTSGKISFNNEDVLSKTKKEMKEYRKGIQIIFQDPYSSLNPKHTVRQILSEPLIISKEFTKKEINDRVESLVQLVGLDLHHLGRYPHEFSGGQRQRIGIARAIALNPQLIVCDEPVSALDVSIQSQILNLLKKLQKELNLTYIFISHDLSVVEHISDRVAVMYLGKFVEVGTRDQIFNNPQHPYTKILLSSVPIADPKRKKMNHRVKIEGDIPSPQNPPKGCPFYSRCPVRMDICSEAAPELRKVNSKQQVACYLIEN